MHKTVVINAVGLTPKLLERMANLRRFAAATRVATIGHVLPAVTCSVQTTYLTGTLPREHGIVGNGWYFRDTCEVRFWHQSDKLVQRPRIWDIARQRDPSFTCANLFWWYAMYSTCDVTITPRPMYPADGRKIPDLWTHPAWVRSWQQHILPQFPLFRFWGPAASIESTRWIADAAIEVDVQFNPTLSLIYLPHLDYGLQRFGPDDPRIDSQANELDVVICELIDHFQKTARARVIILSEYGIAPVSRPVHLNRVLRQHKLLTVRSELQRELLDAGASAAFAVADHQVAHVYVNDHARLQEVRQVLCATPGVAEVLDRDAQRGVGLDHPRSGEFVVVAEPGAWFTYYYWLEDDRAPDFARTVDIHRKPGYDPVELFIDPKLPAPKLKIAWTLLKRKLGFRSLLEVIPLDATLVRGSHGRPPADPSVGPMLISSEPLLLATNSLVATDVRDVILRHVFD
ncbi:alkaline phosphatase family protein [Fontivita pretiosa]|uniref:alkaline phosphatase family protein n=1 Tax=Fontivita pretiosa TaxID=2989684 RepID=UPI003D1825ED